MRAPIAVGGFALCEDGGIALSMLKQIFFAEASDVWWIARGHGVGIASLQLEVL